MMVDLLLRQDSLATQARVANLQGKLAKMQAQQAQFIQGLETKNPAYFRYKYDNTLYNLEDVKKYLTEAQKQSKLNSTLIE